MRKSKILAKLAKIEEKVKSHDLEEARQLLTNLGTQLMKPTTRPQAVEVISTRRRPAAQELPIRYPNGELIPTTWRPPVYEMLTGYVEGEGDIDIIWFEARKTIRLPTAAEQENTIAANITRYQQQPVFAVATDLAPEEGIGVFLEEGDSEYLLLLKVTFGKLNYSNFTVDCCLPDRNTNGYSLQYPELNYDNQLYIDSIPFWTEIVGEIFNSEITVKGQTPSYLAHGRKNIRSLHLALKRIMALPDECGDELYNDLTAWFKHWASKSVELYENRAYIEFSSRMVYLRP